MGDLITENDITVEKLETEYMYLVRVGKIECYLVHLERIYKCNSFYTLSNNVYIK